MKKIGDSKLLFISNQMYKGFVLFSTNKSVQAEQLMNPQIIIAIKIKKTTL